MKWKLYSEEYTSEIHFVERKMKFLRKFPEISKEIPHSDARVWGEMVL